MHPRTARAEDAPDQHTRRARCGAFENPASLRETLLCGRPSRGVDNSQFRTIIDDLILSRNSVLSCATCNRIPCTTGGPKRHFSDVDRTGEQATSTCKHRIGPRSAFSTRDTVVVQADHDRAHARALSVFAEDPPDDFSLGRLYDENTSAAWHRAVSVRHLSDGSALRGGHAPAGTRSQDQLTPLFHAEEAVNRQHRRLQTSLHREVDSATMMFVELVDPMEFGKIAGDAIREFGTHQRVAARFEILQHGLIGRAVRMRTTRHPVDVDPRFGRLRRPDTVEIRAARLYLPLDAFFCLIRTRRVSGVYRRYRSPACNFSIRCREPLASQELLDLRISCRPLVFTVVVFEVVGHDRDSSCKIASSMLRRCRRRANVLRLR
ncbi:hypothetical protein SAMN02799627_04605 [Methylobacterium sp. 13MFTsu3.1M2]|nr:hypothetical protein SAMN02799627_04605 [Methylobacterium sp. 13MFTsu3.1M2]